MSAIIGPKGDFVAGAVFDEETIVYGEVDIELAMEQKVTHDIVGHYRRAGIYTVTVNRQDPDLIVER